MPVAGAVWKEQPGDFDPDDQQPFGARLIRHWHAHGCAGDTSWEVDIPALAVVLDLAVSRDGVADRLRGSLARDRLERLARLYDRGHGERATLAQDMLHQAIDRARQRLALLCLPAFVA